VTVTRRRVVQRVTVEEAEPCACDRHAPCLWHFAELSPDQRLSVARRVGVTGVTATAGSTRFTGSLAGMRGRR
jgi:hypothetical protein